MVDFSYFGIDEIPVNHLKCQSQFDETKSISFDEAAKNGFMLPSE
jgi:hypothetical protein